MLDCKESNFDGGDGLLRATATVQKAGEERREISFGKEISRERMLKR
jgi:hypothetical protein